MSDESKAHSRSKKYHRRSAIACDECKLRKKKCDGNQPCKSCNLYQKECTYDAKTRPSTKPTVRIRELEDTIRNARNLVARLSSGPSDNNTGIVEDLFHLLRPAAANTDDVLKPAAEQPIENRPLQSMLPGTGVLLRGPNACHFHGAYSGPAMICAILDFFEGSNSEAIHDVLIDLFDAPEQIPADAERFHGAKVPALPDRSQAASLFGVVMSQTHPFLQFLDIALGFELSDVLEYSYGTSINMKDGDGAIALCQIILALGYLLDQPQNHGLQCEYAFQLANHHYEQCRRTLLSSAINDIRRLGTMVCMINFLVFSNRFSAAYSYIAIASTSAIRQGLHLRFVEGTEGVASRQVLTTLVNIDLYVSTLIGLPPLVNLDTAGTTLEAVRQPAQHLFGDLHLRENFQAVASDTISKCCQVTALIAGVMWDYTTTPSNGHGENITDLEVLLNAERDLRGWTTNIGLMSGPNTPRTLTSSPNTISSLSTPSYLDSSPRLQTARHHLELVYYHAQLLLYIPFIHYLKALKEKGQDGATLPDSHSRPALACLKVAVQTIKRCDAHINCATGVLTPASCPAIYTLFIATLTLIYLISIHDGTSRPGEAWRYAECGIRCLVALQCHRYSGSVKCLAIIKAVVKQLNHTVDFNFDDIELETIKICATSAAKFGAPSPSNRQNQVASGDSQDVSIRFNKFTADQMLARAQETVLTNEKMTR